MTTCPLVVVELAKAALILVAAAGAKEGHNPTTEQIQKSNNQVEEAELLEIIGKRK